MASDNMVRWLFVGPSDTLTTPYIDSFNDGRPVLTTSVEGTNVQITLDHVSLASGSSLDPLAERLDTHFTDIIITMYDSSQRQTRQILEALLSLKNLPQSCFLCDTNTKDDCCLVIEQIAAPYISPGYSFHYIHVFDKDPDILKNCLLTATKYCLRRRRIMLLNFQTTYPETTDGTQPTPAESSSPAVSLSPTGPLSQATRKTYTKIVGAANLVSPLPQPPPAADQRPSNQVLSSKGSSKVIAKQISAHAQDGLQDLQGMTTPCDQLCNTDLQTNQDKEHTAEEFDLPVDMGDGTEALFHGFIGQDPGEAMLKFMQKNNVSSRDYVMLYDKIKHLMIQNGYLSDENPTSPHVERSTDLTEKGKLIFSTNILFGAKKIKIDFYETDTSEEVARRTVQSLGLGQNYEVFLRKKIDAICNSMKKK